MIGTLRWNVVIGFIGMIITILLSIGHNTLLTSLIRGFYSLIILFIAAFIIRFILGIIIGMNEKQSMTNDNIDDKHKGGNVDLSTPHEEDDINETLKKQLQFTSQTNSFSPLDPPKLASKDKVDPTKLVEAIRQMSED